VHSSGLSGRQAWNFFAASFVTSGYGVAPAEAGWGAVLLSIFIGAFFGLIGGLIVSQLMRYVSYVSGRNLGNHAWTIGGVVLGALIFAWIALVGDKD
jgi:hypothetical protein